MELVPVSGQLVHRPDAASRTAPAGYAGDGLSEAGSDLFGFFLRKYDRLRQQLRETIVVGCRMLFHSRSPQIDVEIAPTHESAARSWPRAEIRAGPLSKAGPRAKYGSAHHTKSMRRG